MTREQAQKIVEKIVNDMTDRRGLRQAWDQIDEDIQAEIIATWVDLVATEEP